MELRHIRYFIKLAELLHFTQAAAALNVSQPTLSLQIKQLEDELGTRLFERSGRAVHLTGTGELFLGYARRAIGEIAAGQQGIQDLHGMLRGNLRIGVTYSFSAELLPNILSDFIDAYPAVHIHVGIGTNYEIQEAVNAGQLDVGLVCLPSTVSLANSRHLFREEIVAVVSRKHHLAGLDSLRLRDLEGERLALPTSGYQTRQLIDAAFAAARIRHRVVLESDDVDVLLGLARRGIAVTLVTRQAAAHLHSQAIARIPLKERGLQLSAAFIWPGTSCTTPAAKRLVELSTDYLARNQRQFAAIDTAWETEAERPLGLPAEAGPEAISPVKKAPKAPPRSRRGAGG